MSSARAWDSLHVFYHRSPSATDALLVNGVAPVLNAAARGQRLSSWFFIRYWAGGPHVRIRVKDAEAHTLAEIEQQLASCLAEQATGDDPALNPADYYGAIGQPPGVAHDWHDDRTIARIPYEPEVDRYGGAAGLAISEQFFAQSTQTALAAIRFGGTRATRLRVALDVVFATVLALDLPILDAASWLRQHVMSWMFSPEAPVLPADSIRRHAEQEFLAKVAGYRQRLDQIREEIQRGATGSLCTHWHAQVRHCLADYGAAATAGTLTRPPLEIMKSQLHMFQNRLGLSMGDELYVCWLASLALLRNDATSTFFDDGHDAADRLYHEQSKYFEQRVGMQKPDRNVSSKYRPMFSNSRNAIPMPAATATSLTTSLGDAIVNRHTGRVFRGRLSFAELATLLQMSASTLGHRLLEIPETPTSAARTIPLRHRTYPSAGAKYPVRIMVLAQHVDQLTPGLYLYDHDHYALEPVAGPPPTDVLDRLSPLVNPDVGGGAALNASEIPLWIFAVADFSYLRDTYGARAYRFTAIECGHLGQNVSLAATALGLSSMMLGGYYDDAVNHMLFIDGIHLATMYVMLVGKPEQDE